MNGECGDSAIGRGTVLARRATSGAAPSGSRAGAAGHVRHSDGSLRSLSDIRQPHERFPPVGCQHTPGVGSIAGDCDGWNRPLRWLHPGLCLRGCGSHAESGRSGLAEHPGGHRRWNGPGQRERTAAHQASPASSIHTHARDDECRARAGAGNFRGLSDIRPPRRVSAGWAPERSRSSRRRYWSCLRFVWCSISF